MPKFPKTIKKFVVTVETSEDIFDLYPNFRFNWDNPEQFIESLAQEIGRNGEDSYGENTFGYCVDVEPLQ